MLSPRSTFKLVLGTALALSAGEDELRERLCEFLGVADESKLEAGPSLGDLVEEPRVAAARMN